MDENEKNNEGMHLADLIEESLFEQWQELSNIVLGSEEHLTASKALSEQAKAWTEMTRIELEYNDRIAQRESDEKIKLKQSSDQKRATVIGLIASGISGAARIGEVYLTLRSYNSMFDRGLTFEQTGAVTSGTFKNYLKTIRPNKI